MIAFSSAEIALLAFMASDELKEEGKIGDRLLQREISSALWSIALHCVEVQTWQDELKMRVNVELMGKQCSAIIWMTGIPEPMPEETLAMHAPEDLRVQNGRTQMQTMSPAELPATVPGGNETSLATAPPEDQIESLKIEIKALREILAALVLKRDMMNMPSASTWMKMAFRAMTRQRRSWVINPACWVMYRGPSTSPLPD